MLQHLQTVLIGNIDAWNEQELALSCIGPLFTLVNFSELYRFNLFSQRKIGTVLAGASEEI